MTTAFCPLCEDLQPCVILDGDRGLRITCKLCGEFAYTGEAKRIFSVDPDLRLEAAKFIKSIALGAEIAHFTKEWQPRRHAVDKDRYPEYGIFFGRIERTSR